MTVPRVSIGLTVENGAGYVAVALDSLLTQTFCDFELIVSDDGSTDGTESICRSYAARDPRIRYYREPRTRGPIWNSNRVFDLSSGAYFKWATYDEVCAPTYLARCVELLDSDPSLAWCHTLSNHIDLDGQLVPADDDPAIPEGESAFSLNAAGPDPANSTRCSARPHERFRGVILGPSWCPDSYGLIRSDVLRRTRLLRPCYGPAKVLLAEVSLLGRFEEVAQPLFFERTRPDATCAPTTEAQRYAVVPPRSVARYSSTRVKLFWEYVQVVRRAHLRASERARCLAVLARYVFQVDKWKRLLLRDFNA